MIELRKARKAAETLRKFEAMDAAEKALLERHPDAALSDIESWAEQVIAYQRGKGEKTVRRRVRELLGAEHPLLVGGGK